jgi:hypothetical protein
MFPDNATGKPSPMVCAREGLTFAHRIATLLWEHTTMKKIATLAVSTMLAVACNAHDDNKSADEQAVTAAPPPSVLGQTWTDGPTITMKINGQDTVLKNAGMGIRWGTPTSWKSYLDPHDTLADAKQFPESPNEALVPVYALTVFVTDPSTVVRQDANPPGSSFDSPFLHSVGKQTGALVRFTLVRPFDVDIFVNGLRNKFKNNGFPMTGATDAELAADIFPEDRKTREQFTVAYQKVGWYDKGDNLDFIFEHTPEGKCRVSQIHRTIRALGKVDHVLYTSEAPGRLPYAEGSADFCDQVLSVWFGKNNDGADPGMSLARKTIIHGDQSVTF